MKNRKQRQHDLTFGVRPPKAPARLKKRTMQSVERALHRKEIVPSLDLWDRLWFSNQLRLAWAATVGVLLSCHLLLPWLTAIHEPKGPILIVRSTAAGWGEELEVLAETPTSRLNSAPIHGAVLTTRNIIDDELELLD
jgi:hypothetical protein